MNYDLFTDGLRISSFIKDSDKIWEGILVTRSDGIKTVLNEDSGRWRRLSDLDNIKVLNEDFTSISSSSSVSSVTGDPSENKKLKYEDFKKNFANQIVGEDPTKAIENAEKVLSNKSSLAKGGEALFNQSQTLDDKTGAPENQATATKDFNDSMKNVAAEATSAESGDPNDGLEEIKKLSGIQEAYSLLHPSLQQYLKESDENIIDKIGHSLCQMAYYIGEIASPNLFNGKISLSEQTKAGKDNYNIAISYAKKAKSLIKELDIFIQKGIILEQDNEESWIINLDDRTDHLIRLQKSILTSKLFDDDDKFLLFKASHIYANLVSEFNSKVQIYNLKNPTKKIFKAQIPDFKKTKYDPNKEELEQETNDFLNLKEFRSRDESAEWAFRKKQLDDIKDQARDKLESGQIEPEEKEKIDRKVNKEINKEENKIQKDLNKEMNYEDEDYLDIPDDIKKNIMDEIQELLLNKEIDIEKRIKRQFELSDSDAEEFVIQGMEHFIKVSNVEPKSSIKDEEVEKSFEDSIDKYDGPKEEMLDYLVDEYEIDPNEAEKIVEKTGGNLTETIFEFVELVKKRLNEVSYGRMLKESDFEDWIKDAEKKLSKDQLASYKGFVSKEDKEKYLRDTLTMGDWRDRISGQLDKNFRRKFNLGPKDSVVIEDEKKLGNDYISSHIYSIPGEVNKFRPSTVEDVTDKDIEKAAEYCKGFSSIQNHFYKDSGNKAKDEQGVPANIKELMRYYLKSYVKFSLLQTKFTDESDPFWTKPNDTFNNYDTIYENDISVDNFVNTKGVIPDDLIEKHRFKPFQNKVVKNLHYAGFIILKYLENLPVKQRAVLLKKAK